MQKPLFWLIVSILLSIIAVYFSLTNGHIFQFAMETPFDTQQWQFLLLHLRIPRTIAAFTTGGLLALAGTIMQLLVQNPLADPYILGISGAAALSTLICMQMGISADYLIIGAWLGTVCCMTLILLLAKLHEFHSQTLLLTGVILSSVFAAGISFLLLISANNNIHNMLFWLTGDLNAASLPLFGCCMLLVCLLLCCLLARGLNVLSLGEMHAQSLGISLTKYRLLLFCISSLCTAQAVTQAGCIGFIGLVIPHIARQLIGFSYILLLPTAVLLGGTLLTFADTTARTLLAPIQLPVGILMVALGAPFFLYLLYKQKPYY